MRADRLLTELMILQAKGKTSAATLAVELEVSQRTIYRDMIALSTSGVPVYAEQGVKGGFCLVDGYRTQLTGLNNEELRALFALNIPSILDGLGMDENLSSAMRKLQASLSMGRSKESGWMHQRFLFDSQPWRIGKKTEVNTKSFLSLIQQAVWEDRFICIDMHFYPKGKLFNVKIEPYSLVSKENSWYVVAKRNDNFRIYRLEEMWKVQLLEDQFDRDINFDLSKFWSKWLMNRQRIQGVYPVQILAQAKSWVEIERSLRPFIIGAEQRTLDCEWLVSLQFTHLSEAMNQLLPLGGAVKILTPEPLRLSHQDYAVQILRRYEA